MRVDYYLLRLIQEILLYKECDYRGKLVIVVTLMHPKIYKVDGRAQETGQS